MPQVKAGAKKAGRDLKDVRAIAGLGVRHHGRNSAELTKNAAGSPAADLVLRVDAGVRAVMDVHGWGDVFERLFEMSKRGEWAAMSEMITDDMLEEFCTIATYDELVPKLLKHYGGVTTRAALAHPDAYAGGRDDAEVDDQAAAGFVSRCGRRWSSIVIGATQRSPRIMEECDDDIDGSAGGRGDRVLAGYRCRGGGDAREGQHAAGGTGSTAAGARRQRRGRRRCGHDAEATSGGTRRQSRSGDPGCGGQVRERARSMRRTRRPVPRRTRSRAERSRW